MWGKRQGMARIVRPRTFNQIRSIMRGCVVCLEKNRWYAKVLVRVKTLTYFISYAAFGSFGRGRVRGAPPLRQNEDVLFGGTTAGAPGVRVFNAQRTTADPSAAPQDDSGGWRGVRCQVSEARCGVPIIGLGLDGWVGACGIPGPQMRGTGGTHFLWIVETDGLRFVLSHPGDKYRNVRGWGTRFRAGFSWVG